MKLVGQTTALALALAVILSGCTTHLAEGQKQELEAYEQKGLAITETSPGLAAAMGVLPGAGYCVAKHYVLCVTTIPLWVISLGPLWMPFDTYGAAQVNNYWASRRFAETSKAEALRNLDHRLEDKQISYEVHLREQRSIETKYSPF